MAPVATNDKPLESQADRIQQMKTEAAQIFNPFYASMETVEEDDNYEYNQYKPTWPEVSWEPLGPIDVTDRGLSADPEKKSLLSAATKVKYLTPCIGVELRGIDLRQLSNTQKDELALLIAERGVAFFRDQPINIYEQLELGRYWGPLHKHPTSGIPREPGLDEVHLVWADAGRRPDSTAFSKIELWHSDVTYEVQPPSTTSLKGYTIPETGGDTIWSSGYALYSSLSSGMQKYLEGLSAVHSGVAQAEGTRASGKHVRRPEIETIHPLVRVHPVTGWKSVFVNPGFTRRVVGLPKAESDAVLDFLFRQIAENPDFQVRLNWEKDTIAIWDNRVVTHTAIFDFWPEKRHALRVTPHGEKPMSVAEYEAKTGKVALDRQVEVWKKLGLDPNGDGTVKKNGKRGYND